MKTKHIALLVCAALMLGLLAGCGAAEQESPAPTDASSQSPGSVPAETPQKKYLIGVSQKSNTNPYNIEVADAMRTVVREGDEIIFIDAQQNQSKQINDVEDMIHQGCDVILISPVDWQATRSMLESCQKAGVPAIMIDQNIPEADAQLATTVVCSDNYKAGQLCAESMVEILNGKGKIVIYESSISKAGVDRVAGFEDYIADYPEIVVVNRQDGIGQIDVALEVMENMLQADPDIAAVFAFNDPAAIGCIAAIESAGKINEIAVFGVDGSEQGKEMIRDGKMKASAVQFPAQLGITAIETAYTVLEGGTVDKLILIPVKLITLDNLSEYMDQ
ncbi:MAG: substrate-binding domain-containing protein [Christensenellales bacterium]|jgi:ribose transport system substrate-binding protein